MFCRNQKPSECKGEDPPPPPPPNSLPLNKAAEPASDQSDSCSLFNPFSPGEEQQQQEKQQKKQQKKQKKRSRKLAHIRKYVNKHNAFRSPHIHRHGILYVVKRAGCVSWQQSLHHTMWIPRLHSDRHLKWCSGLSRVLSHWAEFLYLLHCTCRSPGKTA